MTSHVCGQLASRKLSMNWCSATGFSNAKIHDVNQCEIANVLAVKKSGYRNVGKLEVSATLPQPETARCSTNLIP